MQKRTIIKNIKRIISEYGAFGSGEVENGGETYSPCVASMGNYVSLAEHFNSDGVEVNIYDPTGFSSDAVDTYNVDYTELSKDVLEEILVIAEQYEVEQVKLFDSCRDENF